MNNDQFIAAAKGKMRDMLDAASERPSSGKQRKQKVEYDSDDSGDSQTTVVSSVLSKTKNIAPVKQGDSKAPSQTAGGDEKATGEEFEKAAEQHVKFAEAAKYWVKAEKQIQELNVKKAEILALIKEQQGIKDKYDYIIQSYLEENGREEYPIKDGTKITVAVTKKTETFSAKTIPKYMEEVFVAINEEDYAFINRELIPLQDSKNYPDINWARIPNDPKKYLDKLIDDPKFLSVMTVLYANNSRTVEETPILKRTGADGKGKGKGKGKN